MDIEERKTIQRSTVVILGNFNPAIIHPEWLDRNQVLPPNEVRDIAESIARAGGRSMQSLVRSLFVYGWRPHQN